MSPAVRTLLPSVLLASLAVARAGERVQFNRDIRPMLSDNCYYCHGPDKSHREADLRLDVREEALKDRDGFRAIVPGKPDESELMVRILSKDKDELMPPEKAHKTLTAEQKETFRRWIAEGAEYQPHWAYVALPASAKDIPLPPGDAKQPIDRFIRAALAAKKIAPSPAAEPAALARRLHLDLTGIPPTPAEVGAFVEAAGQDLDKAVRDRVEKLLASPHYGERMASPWLDVVRYADTVGFHGDQNMNVWAYRDYVIASFNKNKPFDQFTIEQLAGDLLPNPTPEQLTATCFNRLNMMTREGGAQPKEYLALYTADRVRTVSMAWMGSTVGCAECHDHKFDPWKAKDFYSLGAFFADVKQWGVYNDYNYTPNPDLKGFSNEHPFPPEITVDSPFLHRRKSTLERKMRDRFAAASEARKPEEAKAWLAGVRSFLAAHPGGWAPAPPLAVEKPEKQNDSPEQAKKPAPAKKKKKAPTTAGWEIHAGAARVASIATTIPAGESAATGSIKLTVRLHARDGKVRNLAIYHAEADAKSPRYSNGFEVLGVKDDWRLAKQASAQRAVWLLDAPVTLAEGDRLVVTLTGDKASSATVAWSPLAALDVLRTADEATRMAIAADAPDAAQARLVQAATFLGTAPDAEHKTLLREWLETRGGRTPVLVTEVTDKPLTIRVLARGSWMDETGEIVKPATAHFLPALSGTGERTLNRLDLAKWLVAPENPLTARVVMNRLWKQFFGNGLSAQVEDLGAQGEPPSHPELLDWLATEFRASGWNFKHMVRAIVTSETYRQSAKLRPELREIDPQNRLLASQNPRRLEAEVVRDNALAISGLLNAELGGPPAKPYQPGGYYAGLQFPDREYKADTDSQQWRRGVYSHWQRTFLHPMLANFDAPSREDCVALRTNANTPQQALTLLNDPEFVEAARVWATRLQGASAGTTDAARLDEAFLQAVARKPSERERASLLALLAKAREEYKKLPEDAAKLVKSGYAAPPQGDPVELAAWTTLCRVILNLHETITRY